jgi:histidine ammonia-lyase
VENTAGPVAVEPPPEPLTLDGRTLTCARLTAHAEGAMRVRLSATARRRAAGSAAAADAAAAQRQVYGRTTGVGANKDVPVDDADPGAGLDHMLGLLRSHATSAGPLRSATRVRAMLVVRLNQLAAGGSGISVAAVDALAAMINADALPPIREHSGIGTGDLTALATAALGLLGEVPLTRPLTPVRLGVHDALPFFSSNAATLADAALATSRLRQLSRAGLAVAALTGVAVQANLEAFGPVVERGTPGPGARLVCRTVLALCDPGTGTAETAGPADDLGPSGPALSPRTADPADAAAVPGTTGLSTAGRTFPRIQDPFAMRCLPQVNGLLMDALDRLESVVSAHLNVAAENPVIVPGPDGSGPIVAHHGAFHIPAVSLACDSAAIAVAQSVPLLLGRLAMLVDPSATGLPPFLGDGRPGSSGVMMLEYLAASALADLRSAAAPASLGSVTLSRGMEEHASFASQAAVQLMEAADAYATALACELLAAVRALRMQKLEVPETGWGALLSACAGLGSDTADRDLTPDLAAAELLLPVLAELAVATAEPPIRPGRGL